MVVAVWSPLSESPGYASMVELLQELFSDAIANELRAPFCLGREPELRRLLESAGIDGANVTQHKGTARFPSIDDWVHTDIRGWTLADRLDDEQFQQLLEAARARLARFVTEDGVRFDSPALLVTAVRAG